MELKILIIGIFFISLTSEIQGTPFPIPSIKEESEGNLQDLSGLIEIGNKAKVPDSIIYKIFEYEQLLGPINIHIQAKNSKITGYNEYRVFKLLLDKEDNVIRFEFEVPYLKIQTDYKLSGNAFFFPIHGAGPATFEIIDHKIHGHAKFEIIDDKIIQLREPTISNIEIGNMKAKIHGLFDGNPLFNSLAKYIETRYWRDIFELAKPEISQHAGNLMITQILNPILAKNFFLKN